MGENLITVPNTRDQPLTDQQLAELASQGKQEAFALLYERYFSGIYDFTVRIIRDQDEAGDIVQATFIKAWQQLQQAKPPQNIKAWLYKVARNAAIDELRRQTRLIPPATDKEEGDPSPLYTAIDTSRLSDPQQVLVDNELVELVWQSAAALNPKEYALLDMQLRQGLNADELAEVLGVSKGAVYTKLSRLKDALEQAVVAALLFRQGRRDCPQLDALLSQLKVSELTRKVRRIIWGHLQECAHCQESKRRYASPVAILGALAPVPAPVGLQDLLWLEIAAQIDHTDGPIDKAYQADQPRGHLQTLTGKFTTFLAVLSTAIIVGLFWPPQDPADVYSISHQIGQPSENNVVTIVWSGLVNARAYSVSWSQDAPALPDAIADPAVGKTGSTSPALPLGNWYFNLRTQGWNGRWTSTVHLGPFLIKQELAKPTIIPTVELTPTPTVEPTPTIEPTVVPTEPPSQGPSENGETIDNEDNTPPNGMISQPDPAKPVNAPPIAEPIIVALEEDTSIVIALNHYASPGPPNEDNQPLIFTLGTRPSHGTAELKPDNTLTYKPRPDYHGPDRFTYRACNNHQACTTAEVTISVVPVPEFHKITAVKLSPSSPNKLPAEGGVAVNFQYSTTEASGVLIPIRPYHRGKPISARITPSPIYATGTGSGSGGFAVKLGVVDEIRIEMRAVDNDELLDEVSMSVTYQFGSSVPDSKGK